MHIPWWGWLVFVGFVAVCFVVDLVLGHRGDREVTMKEAAGWSVVWAVLGLAFTLVVLALGGGVRAGEYLAGFLIEKSLSVDNVFVFAMLFAYFAVPAKEQHRVLLLGIIGALILRGVFIAAGASLLAAFHWTVFVLGALLVVTGVRMAVHDETEVHPDRNPVLRLVRKLAPNASPLVPVLVVVATTDVLFAVDSVPAVFAVTRDTFIVFAANAFSVLGLRPLYFLLAGAMERFRLLKYGLAAVLVFVGAKMLLADVVHLSVWISLLVIVTILGISMAASSVRSSMTRLPVRLHISVVVAAGLVTLLLATSVLPRSVPGLPGAAYAVASVAGAVLFLGSVLLHELAHAVFARRNGLTVKRVTLWALGGMTEIDGDARGPGASFRIAAAGPLTSAVLGAVLVGVAVAGSGLAAAVFGWLGVTNLILAVFNLLPGAPLDGGRIVSAAVWARTGDQRRGRLAAARAGRVLGALLVLAGAADMVFGSLVGGLWLAVIGMFLAATARLEGAQATATSALAGRRVRDVMTPAVASPGWLTVDAFLERIVQPSRDTVFPLVAFDGSPAGVVDVSQLVSVPADARASVRVASVATPVSALPVVRPDDPAERLVGAPLALVVADGSIVGVVTPVDVSRAVALGSAENKVGA